MLMLDGRCRTLSGVVEFEAVCWVEEFADVCGVAFSPAPAADPAVSVDRPANVHRADAPKGKW